MKREAERDFHKFIKYVAELEKENKELKDKLLLTENDRDEWEVKAKDFEKRLNKLLDNMSWMS
jgi:septal ring factor EnvC (AmiA/AmiB activator)